MFSKIGHIYTLTDFGESHGPAIGGVIDGVPAGMAIDTDSIEFELARRRPGSSSLSSARREADKVHLLSGIFEGRTTGTPIGFTIGNTDARPADYEAMRDVFRPNHADYTYTAKYGMRDHRGGGRASARETAARVVAGAIALQALGHYGIEVHAYTSAIGNIEADIDMDSLNADDIWASDVRCPDAAAAEAMRHQIADAASKHDSVGGVVACCVTGVPTGLGEPTFGRLDAMLASAMMSIPAAKAFESGDGIAASSARGSQMRDVFCLDQQGRVATKTNHSGGVQGGISNGMPLTMRVFFKPTPTIMQPCDTLDTAMRATVVNPQGRHDPCVVPRAVSVVRAMAAMTVLDALLINRTRRL